MYNKELILKLKEIINPFLEKEGIDLVDMRLYRQRKKTILRILADKPNGGINIEECANLNRHIGDLLDETGVIENSYVLEVSSPGLDRPLVSLKDYKRLLGREIKITTINPVNNSCQLQGRLININEKSIDILCDNIEINISLDNIKHAKQVI